MKYRGRFQSMEKNAFQTPPKSPKATAKENNNHPSVDRNTQSPSSQIPSSITCVSAGKTGTPERLKVPKAFKYPERYRSPTDQMMSPVTRGILARSRKGSRLLPPSVVDQPKIFNMHTQVPQLQELGTTSTN